MQNLCLGMPKRPSKISAQVARGSFWGSFLVPWSVFRTNSLEEAGFLTWHVFCIFVCWFFLRKVEITLFHHRVGQKHMVEGTKRAATWAFWDKKRIRKWRRENAKPTLPCRRRAHLDKTTHPTSALKKHQRKTHLAFYWSNTHSGPGRDLEKLAPCSNQKGFINTYGVLGTFIFLNKILQTN